MATVKDVLYKFHTKVPFPLSVAKIKKAGLEPTLFILEMGRELEKCSDINTETGREVLSTIHALKLLG